MSCGSNSPISLFFLNLILVLGPALASTLILSFLSTYVIADPLIAQKEQGICDRNYGQSHLASHSAPSTHSWVSLAYWDSSISRMKACFWHSSAAGSATCGEYNHRAPSFVGYIASSIQDLVPDPGGSHQKQGPIRIVRDSRWKPHHFKVILSPSDPQ